MKRAALLATVLAVSAPAAAPAGAPRLRAPLVPRDLSSLARHPETLLAVEPQAGPALRAAGAEPVAPRLGIWSLPSGAASRLIPKLAVAGGLREFAPVRPLRPAGHITAGDPLLARQWWYQRVGADVVEPPGPGVPLTVIDSGLDVTHPEFSARPATTLLTAQSTVGRREFHGTAVASVAAAPANGVGVVGVYPEVALHSWDASPRGLVSTRELVQALGNAAALGRSVVNVSLGGVFRDPIVESAVFTAFERGVVVVAASGNDAQEGNGRFFPAALPHVVTVGSTDEADRASLFSTRSVTVDLAAPGEAIPVAVPLDVDPSGFITAEGTSFSAPIVAGTAALVWTLRPTLDKTQLVELLRRTARDVDAPGRDQATGFGLIDLPTALTAPAPPVDPLEPNDDVSHVTAGGIAATPKAPLTRPGRGRATLRARVDLAEDPEDVYRVWVPARSRIVVSVRSPQDVDLQIWGPRTPSVHAPAAAGFLLAESARLGTGAERAAVANGGRRGRFVFVDVFPREGQAQLDASYTLQVTTARARR